MPRVCSVFCVSIRALKISSSAAFSRFYIHAPMYVPRPVCRGNCVHVCCHVFHLGTWTRTLGSSSPRRVLGFFFPSSAAPISFSFYCFCTFFSFLFSTKCNRCVHDSVNTAEMYETAVLDQITLPLRRYPHSASALLRRSQSPLFPKSLRLKTSQSVLKPTCLSSSIFTCF